MYRKGNYPGNPPVPTGPAAGFSDFSYSGGTPTPRGGFLQVLNQKPVKAPNGVTYYGLSKDAAQAQSMMSTDALKKPYARDEAIRKIMNNISFTSNTFAVWLTVGFFEVKSDGTLGNELFYEENRQIRHRMFAIVDRSQLVMPTSAQISASPSGNTPRQERFSLPRT